MIKKSLTTIILFSVLWVTYIYFFQDRMIYFPRGYAKSSKIFKKVEKITYVSGGASQMSFLYPADRSDPPTTVWWMFGGNGATAIDWISMLERGRFSSGHAFVLVDYPGYGRCGGKPGPEAIFASVDDLHKVLAEKWSFGPEVLSERSKAMGHSLGAAVALNTAARFAMDEVIAVSPFTTMDEMAKRRVGSLSFLLKHHYDNRESVSSLVSRPNPAKLHIFHGTNDSIIPTSMGRELAQLAGSDDAYFHPVKGRGHNDVLHHISKQLQVLLAQ